MGSKAATGNVRFPLGFISPDTSTDCVRDRNLTAHWQRERKKQWIIVNNTTYTSLTVIQNDIWWMLIRRYISDSVARLTKWVSGERQAELGEANINHRKLK